MLKNQIKEIMTKSYYYTDEVSKDNNISQILSLISKEIEEAIPKEKDKNQHLDQSDEFSYRDGYNNAIQEIKTSLSEKMK